MTSKEAKEAVYSLVSGFFSSAAVRWSRTKGVSAPAPFITLDPRYLRRDTFPSVNEDGERCYNCTQRYEINLYTEGSEVEDGTSSSSHVYENTAISDLEQFFRYLDSPAGTDDLCSLGMSFMAVTDVSDLTELLEGIRYSYRARAEFDISFMLSADGLYGLYGESLPNASGGGSEDFVEAETESIERIGISGSFGSSGYEDSIEINKEG